MKSMLTTTLLVLLIRITVISQVSLSTNYFENFGTSDITSWTNNSTFQGWYMQSTWRGHQNITASSPSNSGGFYSYECSGNNNQKIGGRASGSANPVYYGLRLRNTSGSTINYLEISFDWFQFSLAQNGGNNNTVSVHYRVSPTVTSLTAGTWSAIPALNFSAPMSSGTAGSNQINGYPCTQSGNRSTCLAVTIPNNQEIMLRWRDPDDGSNDPHLGIDNVFVGISTDPGCFTILPTILSDFSASGQHRHHALLWNTASEINLDYFDIEYSTDGFSFNSIGTIHASGEATHGERYSFDHFPVQSAPIHYYRLKLKDFDGQSSYSLIRMVKEEQSSIYAHAQKIHLGQWTPKDHEGHMVYIHDINGKLVYEGHHLNHEIIPWNHAGVFIVSIPDVGIRERLLCL